MITIELLAKWLTITAHQIGVNTAIDQLHTFLTAKGTPARAILAISGIAPEEEITISGSLKLVPFESLPSSTPKTALAPLYLKNEFLIQQGFIPFHPQVNSRYPKAALVKDIEIFPKVIENFERDINPIDYSELYEACEFLALVKKSTPVPAGSWPELDVSVPCKQVLGSSWSYQTPDVLSNTDTILNTSDWLVISDIYAKFSRLRQKDRDLLRIPFQRLNQARRRRNLADKAIDQGVAFEALFLNDKSHMDNISFTFRLRASLYLGQTIQERQYLMEFFTAFYSCRSEAAHTGKLGPAIKVKNRGKITIAEILNESDTLCERTIIKIIEDGGFPDWTNLMLGTN